MVKLSALGLLLCLVCVTACNHKVVCFKTTVDNKSVKYKIVVPKGYHLLVITGNHEKEYDVVYKDSSIIFISDDMATGSSVNKEKYKKYGTNIGLQFVTQDTLHLDGIDDLGKYWKEEKLKYIVYGLR